MKKFIKFCLVGLSNSAITFLVFYFLSEILGINYLLSSSIGYIIGVVNSYILNKKWTFADVEKKVLLQFIKFMAVNLISLTVNLAVIYYSVELFHLNKSLSQIIAMGFSIVINYLGSKILVFDNSKISDLQKIIE